MRSINLAGGREYQARRAAKGLVTGRARRFRRLTVLVNVPAGEPEGVQNGSRRQILLQPLRQARQLKMADPAGGFF